MAKISVLAGTAPSTTISFCPIAASFTRCVMPVCASRTRYVFGSDGVIVYAEVNPDYTRRPDPSELLPVLDRLRTSQAA